MAATFIRNDAEVEIFVIRPALYNYLNQETTKDCFVLKPDELRIVKDLAECADGDLFPKD